MSIGLLMHIILPKVHEQGLEPYIKQFAIDYLTTYETWNLNDWPPRLKVNLFK
jgi:hypothetical protein